MAKTLLQKAMAVKKQSRSAFVASKQMEEIALAWCRDEITHTQICKALGLNNTGYRVYAKLALTLKKYFNDNYKK